MSGPSLADRAQQLLTRARPSDGHESTPADWMAVLGALQAAAADRPPVPASNIVPPGNLPSGAAPAAVPDPAQRDAYQAELELEAETAERYRTWRRLDDLRTQVERAAIPVLVAACGRDGEGQLRALATSNGVDERWTSEAVAALSR